jgi:lipid-binding SYLF domain-containing protein
MRTGLWISGAGGSGILVGKLPDGSWSPPSGIMLHTAGVGFLVGVDIYDCVVVLNTDEALAAFSKVRCTLGAEISAVAGPVGIGGVLDSEVHKRRSPIFTYLKSRGFYAGVQLDGSIVIERTDENERFYSRRISVGDIISGKVLYPPPETLRLLHTIKAAQGDTDFDPELVPDDAPPGDFELEDDQPFGIPDRDDPDPYGVLALEQEGVQIKEAGTKKVASRESFQFSPSPTSPIFNMFSRDSTDGGVSRRSSWRTSITEKSIHTIDTSTQTDFDAPSLPPRPLSATYRSSMANIPEDPMPSIDQQISKGTSTAGLAHEEPIDQTIQPEAIPEAIPKAANPILPTIETTEPELKELSAEILAKDADADVDANLEHPAPLSSGIGKVPQLQSPEDPQDEDADDEDDGDDDEAVIHEVQQITKPQFVTASPQVVSKARLVTVAKVAPPALPPRNPGRVRTSGSQSPTRSLDGLPQTSRIDRIDTSAAQLHNDGPNSAEPPVTAYTSSSVYSLSIHDEPSSTQNSGSAGSVSSAEHPDHEKHREISEPPPTSTSTSTTAIETQKPSPPMLPPRDTSES